jgi:hypothetical protein
MEQVENRELCIEDKSEELDQSDKTKMLRKYKWNMQVFWYTINRLTLWILDIEGEELKLKA